jgi:hypothetical protein
VGVYFSSYDKIPQNGGTKKLYWKRILEALLDKFLKSIFVVIILSKFKIY